MYGPAMIPLIDDPVDTVAMLPIGILAALDIIDDTPADFLVDFRLLLLFRSARHLLRCLLRHLFPLIPPAHRGQHILPFHNWIYY